MNRYYDILKAPIITEETNRLMESQNKYTFKVDKKANKVDIKKAVEAIFQVNVLSVNTINMRRKFKRMGKYEGYRPAYKKAIVEIAEGQRIDAFTV
jgi:large subunit ribosomal protein L23